MLCNIEQVPCRSTRLALHLLSFGIIVHNLVSACQFALWVRRRFHDAQARRQMRPNVEIWLPRAAAALVAAHVFWTIAIGTGIAKAWASPACCRAKPCCLWLSRTMSLWNLLGFCANYAFFSCRYRMIHAPELTPVPRSLLFSEYVIKAHFTPRPFGVCERGPGTTTMRSIQSMCPFSLLYRLTPAMIDDRYLLIGVIMTAVTCCPTVIGASYTWPAGPTGSARCTASLPVWGSVSFFVSDVTISAVQCAAFVRPLLDRFDRRRGNCCSSDNKPRAAVAAAAPRAATPPAAPVPAAATTVVVSEAMSRASRQLTRRNVRAVLLSVASTLLFQLLVIALKPRDERDEDDVGDGDTHDDNHAASATTLTAVVCGDLPHGHALSFATLLDAPINSCCLLYSMNLKLPTALVARSLSSVGRRASAFAVWSFGPSVSQLARQPSQEKTPRPRPPPSNEDTEAAAFTTNSSHANSFDSCNPMAMAREQRRKTAEAATTSAAIADDGAGAISSTSSPIAAKEACGWRRRDMIIQDQEVRGGVTEHRDATSEFDAEGTGGVLWVGMALVGWRRAKPPAWAAHGNVVPPLRKVW